jgi:hypothetical protein
MKKFTNHCLIMLALASAITLVGCGKGVDTGETTLEEMEFTEKNQDRLTKAVPNPELKDSLERRNLAKFNLYWNKSDRISYIYLISRTGTVMGHYTIVGKITYCSSKLTTREQVLELGHGSRMGSSRHVVESPGLDGTYGPSEDAIFFYTQENPEVPVIWKGDYLVSGVPMNITTQPVLVQKLND